MANAEQFDFKHKATRECSASANAQGESRPTPCGAGYINARTPAVVPSHSGDFSEPTAGGDFLCLYGWEYGAHSSNEVQTAGTPRKRVSRLFEESACEINRSQADSIRALLDRY